MLHRDSEALFGARDGAVERVALEGHAAGLGDEAAKLLARHVLRGGGAGVVVDLLLDHGAVKIVGAKAERDLLFMDVGCRGGFIMQRDYAI